MVPYRYLNEKEKNEPSRPLPFSVSITDATTRLFSLETRKSVLPLSPLPTIVTAPQPYSDS
jgi:hypothetical protein